MSAIIRGTAMPARASFHLTIRLTWLAAAAISSSPSLVARLCVQSCPRQIISTTYRPLLAFCTLSTPRCMVYLTTSHLISVQHSTSKSLLRDSPARLTPGSPRYSDGRYCAVRFPSFPLCHSICCSASSKHKPRYMLCSRCRLLPNLLKHCYSLRKVLSAFAPRDFPLDS